MHDLFSKAKLRAARRNRRSPVFVSTLEPRLMMSLASGGLPHAGIVLHALKPVDVSVNKSFAGAKLLNAWTPLASLTPPNSRAMSYLDLSAATPFDIKLDTLKQTLSGAPAQSAFARGDAEPLVIALPTPDGTYERFKVVKSETLAPELAAKYPGIKTFVGQGIDDPSATLAMDYTSQGFHAAVRGAGGEYYIDPYFHLNPGAGAVAYWTSDNHSNDESSFTCLTDDTGAKSLFADGASTNFAAGQSISAAAAIAGTTLLGTTLRSYRLAIGATGEYTASQGGTVASALSAIATTVVRLNQVYETDFAIHMTLVANENQVIYTNAATDPYNVPTNASVTNNANETALDNTIGSANYDIGHVYYKCDPGNENGLAGGIGTVGTAGIKGKGYTAFYSPVGDDFVIDYVAHEMGHQFGGRHTYNNINSGQGDSSIYADEVGSGQSIMGYAGLGSTQEDVLIHSVAQFNANNYINASDNSAAQILQYTLTNTSSNGYTSAVKSSTGDSPPTVSVDASSFNIPVSTPFALTAYGADANAGDTLTYSWEQIDGGNPVSLSTVGGITSVPSSTVTSGPVFRVYGVTTNPTRTFPNLTAVLANRTYDRGEQLPSVARAMKFAAIVRDNHSGGGGVALGRINVSTIAGAVFSLTSLNSATSVAGGSTQAITWTNTNTAAGSTINAATVNILLSTDGGNTFSTTLASGVANDGSETVTIPSNVTTSAARIKIAPVGNVFFDVNDANFTITPPANPSATPDAPDLVAASDAGTSSTDNITNRDNSSGTKTLQFSVGNTVSNATVTIYADGIPIGSILATGTTTTVATNGTADLVDGAHSITARQTESSKTESANSTALSVTIETVVPTVDIVNVSPDPRTIGVSSIAIDFSEPVGGFDLADLSLTRSAGSNLLVAGNAPTTANNMNFTVPNLLSATSVSGGYTMLLTAGGSGVTDVAGNAIVANAGDTWTHSLPAWLSATNTTASWNSQTLALTITGAASIIADPGTDNPAVTASVATANLTINPSSGRAVHFASLSLTNGATATLASLGASRTVNNHRVLIIGSSNVTIDANSKLDLTDNDLIVDYTGPSSPEAGIKDMVTAGFHDGDWLGKRITSSTAASTPAGGLFALGVAENADLLVPFGNGSTGPLFAGQSVDDTAVLVKYTHRVDLDLDGILTSNDAATFNGQYTENAPAVWATGDTDFDGLYTSNDAAFFNGFYDESLAPI